MWLWQRRGFEQKLLGELQRQQRSSLFCDTLLQADGILVPAHSCVLAALSPSLAQVLRSGPAPPVGCSRLLELQAVRAGPLLRLVSFLYSGRLQGEGPAEWDQLLQAAASLGIQDLLEEGERRRGEGEGEQRGVEEGERRGVEECTQTDSAGAGICPTSPRTMTSSSVCADGRHYAPPRPTAGHAPSEVCDKYFTLSSSAAVGLAGVSPAKAGAGPAEVAVVPHPGVSDDVTAAQPVGGAFTAAAPAPAAGLGSVAPCPAERCGSARSPLQTNPVIPAESRGGAVLRSRGGAGQVGGAGKGSSYFLIPRSIEQVKVGRKRGRGIKRWAQGRGRAHGRGRAVSLPARPRDRRISFKIRLRRQTNGKLWEVVRMWEEGVASTPRGRLSRGRAWGLTHRQNLPRLSRIAWRKDGLPVVKRSWGRSVGSALPQRDFKALSITSPSAEAPPPARSHLAPPPAPPHKPHPLQHVPPVHNPVSLPQAPPITEDSDEQIEKLLDDIMMGLNILSPIVVETGAGGHGDSGNMHPFPGDAGADPCGPCPYQRPQIPVSPRPESGLLRTQDGPPPASQQSGYICPTETTYPRLPQAADDLRILDHFLFPRDSHMDGAWESSAAGHNDRGGAVLAGAGTCQQQPTIAPARSGISQEPQSSSTAETLGHTSSPWRELPIPEFCSPPPPVTLIADELRLPECLSPLCVEAGRAENATAASAPPPVSPPHPPLPPWLCPFPVPLNVLSTPLSNTLQVPSSPCPPSSRQVQHGSPRDVAVGGSSGPREEARGRKILPRRLCLEVRRKKNGREVEDREEQRGEKQGKPTVAHGGVQRSGCGVGVASSVGQGSVGCGLGGPSSVGQGSVGCGLGGPSSVGQGSVGSGVGGASIVGQGSVGSGVGGASSVGQGSMGCGVGGASSVGQGSMGCGVGGASSVGQGSVGCGVGGAISVARGSVGCGVGRARSVGRGRGRARARTLLPMSSCAPRSSEAPLLKPNICAVSLRSTNICTRKTSRAAGCAGNIRQSDRSTGKLEKHCFCTGEIQTSAVCTRKLKRAGVCADRLKPSADSSDRLKRAGVCADRLKPSGVCADGLKRSAVSSDGLKRAGVCADGLKPSGVCADGLKPSGVCADAVGGAQSGRTALSCTPGPAGPPKRGRGRPRKRKRQEQTAILAPVGSAELMGEHRHEAPRKRAKMVTPSRKGYSLRTLRSRACLEPRAPPSMARLSSLHREEKGEDDTGKQGADRDRDVEEGSEGAVKQEAEEKGSTGRRRKNHEERGSGVRLGEQVGGAAKAQATPTAERGDQATPTAAGGDQATPTADGGDQATPTAERRDRTTPTAEGQDQATPTAERRDMTTPTAEQGDQATPTAEGGEQATPTEERRDMTTPTAEGGDQATPTAEGGDQATPTADVAYADAFRNTERVHDVITTAESEDEEVVIMVKGGRGDWRGEEGRGPAQMTHAEQTPRVRGEELTDGFMGDSASTEQREQEGARVTAGREKESVTAWMGPNEGGSCQDQGERDEAEDEPAGAETDVRTEAASDFSQPCRVSPAPWLSCTGSDRRDLTAGLTLDQSDPLHRVTVQSAGSEEPDEEEEVEVDVLECCSPAPQPINFLLESTAAGLCNGVAEWCDGELSEEEEGEVDVIGDTD